MTARRRPGRPVLHSGPLGGRTRRVSLTLPAELIDEIDRRRADSGRSRSAIAAAVLAVAMELADVHHPNFLPHLGSPEGNVHS